MGTTKSQLSRLLYLVDELRPRESLTEHDVDKLLQVLERVLVDDVEEVVEPLGRDHSGHLEDVPLRDLALLGRAHPETQKQQSVVQSHDALQQICPSPNNRNSYQLFSHLLPKPRTYVYVRLIDGAARIFPNSYAATGNQTHVSRVAPDWDLRSTLYRLNKLVFAYFPTRANCTA